MLSSTEKYILEYINEHVKRYSKIYSVLLNILHLLPKRLFKLEPMSILSGSWVTPWQSHLKILIRQRVH